MHWFDVDATFGNTRSWTQRCIARIGFESPHPTQSDILAALRWWGMENLGETRVTAIHEARLIGDDTTAAIDRAGYLIQVVGLLAATLATAALAADGGGAIDRAFGSDSGAGSVAIALIIPAGAAAFGMGEAVRQLGTSEDRNQRN